MPRAARSCSAPPQTAKARHRADPITLTLVAAHHRPLPRSGRGYDSRHHHRPPLRLSRRGRAGRHRRRHPTGHHHRPGRPRRRRQDHPAAADRRIAPADRRHGQRAWSRHGHRCRRGASLHRLYAAGIRPLRRPQRRRKPRSVRRPARHAARPAHRAHRPAAAIHRPGAVHHAPRGQAVRRHEAKAWPGLRVAVPPAPAAARRAVGRRRSAIAPRTLGDRYCDAGGRPCRRHGRGLGNRLSGRGRALRPDPAAAPGQAAGRRAAGRIPRAVARARVPSGRARRRPPCRRAACGTRPRGARCAGRRRHAAHRAARGSHAPFARGTRRHRAGAAAAALRGRVHRPAGKRLSPSP